MVERCPKVVVVGIDGGSWSILHEFIEDLPNFKKLIREGISLKLRSTIPPVTCPAWKSFTTGLPPEELKVYWWTHLNFRTKRLRFFDSTDFKQDEIWDYLSRYGYKSLVINVPLTFPPKRINGIIIAGFPASDGDTYTWPPHIKEILVKNIGYRVNPRHHIMIDLNKAIIEIYELIQKRFDALFYFIERDVFDFAMVVIFYTDDLQHYLWHNREAIKRAYKIIDENLGKLLEICPKSNIIVVSDHGFEEIRDVFYINRYFFEQGLLKLKNKFKVLKTLTCFINILLRAPFAKDLASRIFTAIPRSIQVKVKRAIVFIDEHSIDKIIDLDSSYVVGVKQGPIFVNKYKLKQEGTSYDDFVKKLTANLMSIEHPRLGRLIKDVYVPPRNREEDVPDLIVIPNEGFEIDLDIAVDSIWGSQSKIRNNHKWVAHHHPIGVFIAYGEGIVRIVKDLGKEELNIWDIAPLVLKIYGIDLRQELIKKRVRSKIQSIVRERIEMQHKTLRRFKNAP